MVRAGVDVVRLNFSHGALADHARAPRSGARRPPSGRAAMSACSAICRGRRSASSASRPARSAGRRRASSRWMPRSPWMRATSMPSASPTRNCPPMCSPATFCCSTTGRSACRCRAIDGPRIKTRVLVGGELGNNKGINRQGGGLSAGALTDKDREDIRIAAALKVDYLARVLSARRRRHERGAQAAARRRAATRCWSRRSSAPRRSRIWRTWCGRATR